MKRLWRDLWHWMTCSANRWDVWPEHTQHHYADGSCTCTVRLKWECVHCGYTTTTTEFTVSIQPR